MDSSLTWKIKILQNLFSQLDNFKYRRNQTKTLRMNSNIKSEVINNKIVQVHFRYLVFQNLFLNVPLFFLFFSLKSNSLQIICFSLNITSPLADTVHIGLFLWIYGKNFYIITKGAKCQGALELRGIVESGGPGVHRELPFSSTYLYLYMLLELLVGFRN